MCKCMHMCVCVDMCVYMICIDMCDMCDMCARMFVEVSATQLEGTGMTAIERSATSGRSPAVAGSRSQIGKAFLSTRRPGTTPGCRHIWKARLSREQMQNLWPFRTHCLSAEAETSGCQDPS